MWSVDENDITMCEGDYGVELPITLEETALGDGDYLKITIKDVMNGTEKLAVDFTDALSLTSAHAEAVPVGKYVYSLDWYHDGTFLCNVIPKAKFTVVDKV